MCSRFMCHLVLLALVACRNPDSGAEFVVVGSALDEALLSVAGSSDTSVFVAGADVGHGPVFAHYDGARWRRMDTGTVGNLWWVKAFDDGTALVVGDRGAVLRYEGEALTRLRTPGLARETLFGVDGRSVRDAWAVGGATGRSGFVFRIDGDSVRRVPLPLDVPRRTDGEVPTMLKVWVDASGHAWIAGDRGTLLRSDEEGGLTVVPTSTTQRLFTVHGRGDDVVVVGGTGNGQILEHRSDFEQAAPDATPLLQGVFVGRDSAIAVGQAGTILERARGMWLPVASPPLAVDSLHSVWVAPSGAVFVVGGNVFSSALDAGVLLVRGAVGVPAIPSRPPAPTPLPTCPAQDVDPAPDASIAARWNEQALGAIRRDLPRPTVHARNLFHLSAAVYDVWAAGDPVADGFLVREKRVLADVSAAMSSAAVVVLRHRYERAVGGSVSAACFRAFLDVLEVDPESDDPDVSFGREVGSAYVEAFAFDGANEADDYRDTTGYVPANTSLVVEDAGAWLDEPGRWQPLRLSAAVTQNGIPLAGGVQTMIGAHWGNVTPFAITRASSTEPFVAGEPAPEFESPEMADWVVEVLRRTSELDAAEHVPVRVDPGAIGNNPLGTNDGVGHAINPATLSPYDPVVAQRADFGRALAEYWADGPSSETPPGHWNVIARKSADHAAFIPRIDGAEVSRLEWDVKTLFALNGALHDAAIAAWDLKRRHDSARPISLVRFMAGLGQRTESAAVDHDPRGLPLVPGLVERITEITAAPGERHAHLAHFIGEIAVRSWRGEPGDPTASTSGVDFVRGVDFVPYQRRSFVTPAFPGFVSGHSTFSRAAAEILAGLSGTPFFPGGFAEVWVVRDSFVHEAGPTESFPLRWATYFDAADQAGQSRLWGGIHIAPDDFSGRRVGHVVGLTALARARAFFDGSAVP